MALTSPAVLGAQATARADSAKKWDVAARHSPAREINFTTDEGTWMSLDVSPDGRQIAFDLLGDIYVMPITGGEARLLLGGGAYETQPRFSPDGRRIAFTSDRDGSDNLWTMNADGTGLRQITREKERQVNSPVWTSDGVSLVGRKHFRNTRSSARAKCGSFTRAVGRDCSLPRAATGSRTRANRSCPAMDAICTTAKTSARVAASSTTGTRTAWFT